MDGRIIDMANCNDLSILVWWEVLWVEVAHCFKHHLIVLTIALTCHYKCLFQAQRKLFKTGTAGVASKKTELGVWGGALSPPAGMLEDGVPYENFRGFRCHKLAYNNPKTN